MEPIETAVEALPPLRSPLNQAQLKLLQLFARDVPEEDLENIFQLIAFYFAEKATNAMEEFAAQNNITEETYLAWSKEHMRTPYRPASNGFSL
jgi:hypothetical protein